MKIRLELDGERAQAVRAELERLGVEIDEGAELVLREAGSRPKTLLGRDAVTNERVFIPEESIVTIEAYGHDVIIFTDSGKYMAGERLYTLAERLDPEKFLRVSNSVIVSRGRIERISPALSMRFALTMSGGRRAVVTRSYYYIFKEAMGI